MRKFFLGALLLLNFAIFAPVSAEDQVIIERISKQEAEDLEIEVPEDVPPGFHQITIEISDDSGETVEKTFEFCKDENGDINWDNECPGLTDEVLAEIAEESTITEGRATRESFPKYDPLQDTETTKDIQIAAFAILYAITTVSRDDRGKERDREEAEEQESLQSIKSGALALLKDVPGRGDLSNSWQNRLTEKSDALFVAVAKFFNSRSPLLTRTALDGSTIRAILGGWALAFPVLGALFGLISAFSVGFESLPPHWTLVALIMAIAIFDAFAGFTAGSIFFILALLTGHISNRPELLTAIGILALFFAPALLASSFRPFRRLVRDNDDRWERMTDYLLGGLLTYWVVTKMVGAMNGLARLELPITDYAEELALVAAGLIAVRMFLEDFAVEHYPMRLRSLHLEIVSETERQQIRTIFFKVIIFFLMAAPFAGSLLNLLLGTLIFAFPQITELRLDERLPKLPILMPKGILKTVIMVFVMALISKWIESLFSSPESFLKWSFVVMALPGLVINYLEAVAEPRDKSWRKSLSGRKIYRLGGAATFALMVLVVSGVDIAGWLVD